MSSKKITILDITLCAIFVAVISAGAFIKVSLFGAVYTIQFLCTNLAALILGKKYGTFSVTAYVILGLIGVPIFAAGSGIWYILSPTFGYLIGFIVGAFFAGIIREKFKGNKFSSYLIASVVGLVCVYLLGIIYVYISKNFFYGGTGITFATIMSIWVLIPLPKDLVLCVISALLCKTLYPVTVKLDNKN